ncbi:MULTISPECIES: beta-L-arabinofuranosidase domain-containing protein [unclassified Nocardioides]|uniref:beta-L-arabinofuranosidase domain-containing protein n=1 Tax=unclassified Nocardioides TaxID=2615069 RepID=UPI00301428CA
MCRLSHLLRAGVLALSVALATLVVVRPASAAELSVGAPVLALGFEDTLADGSSLAHPVTAKAPGAGTPSVTYVPGVTEGSKAVKLANTYLDLGASTALQPSSLSLSFWLKPDVAMAGEEVITWNKQAYNSDGFYLTSESGSVPLALSVGPSTGQPYKVKVGSTNRDTFFPVGQWTHIVVTLDETTQQVRFFRNGLPVTSVVANAVGGSSTGVVTANPALPKTIGFNGPSYNGAFLKGALDEYRLYAGVATHADAAALYEQGGGVLNKEALANMDADTVSLPDTASVALALPSAGANGSAITWASSDEDVISPTGAVTPPGAGDDDVVVTLTATVRFLDGPPVTREYDVTVASVRETLSDSGLDVLVTDEYLTNAAEKEHEYLLSLDSEKFLFWFYKTAGLTPPTAQGYGGWENGNVSGNFRGHAFGHYMSALAMSYASTTDPTVKAALHTEIVEAVEGLAEVQASYDGTARAGYVGPFRDSALNAVEGRGASDDPVVVPYYNLHKVLAGLLAIDRYVDDETGTLALEVAEGFGEYLYGRVSTLADTSVMLRTEYGGMNDSLYDLYLASGGNPHFKAAAEAFDERSLFTALAAGTDVLPGKHANTTIPKLLGALKRYTIFTQHPELYATLTQAEKDALPSYLAAAQNFFRIVEQHHTYATGANSQSEHFHDPDSLARFATEMGETGNPQTAETCNEYNMLKLARELFKLTHDVRYADYYENTFINTIVSSQNPETGMTTYFQAMAPGYYKLYSQPVTDFWCCTGTGMENFSKLGDSIYYTGAGATWVTMFWSSSFTDAAGMTVTTEADLPNDDTVRFTVSGAAGTLRLRVPDWVAGAPTLKVDGAAVTPVVKKGFVVLPVEAGDVVDYTLPMEVRVVDTDDDPDFLALKYGPVLLSAGLGTRSLDAYTGVGIGVRVPRVDADARTSVVVDAASVAAWKQDVADNVVRVADTADGQVQFRLANTVDAADLRFTPHYRRHDERYALYLSYEVKDSEAAQAKILAAKQAARAMEFAVDSLMVFDNNNSEAAKNVQSSGSEVGSFNGQTFRHAFGPSGWFSYDLAVDPAAAQNLLGVRYYTGDVNRSFDIYVDGTKLKTQTVSNAAGSGVFYWQQDALPAAAVADGKVTVRFQSTGGFVGGVFGLRTSRPEVYDADPALAALAATPGTLEPAFEPATTAYTLSVPEGTEQVALDLDPHVAGGLVRVDGVLVDDAEPRTVRLDADGSTTVEIRSFAQDHETSRVYRLSVEEADEPVEPEPEALAATVAPRVTGTAMVGRRLATTTGSWNVAGAQTRVQWLSGGVAVPGATATSYVVRPADAGKRISVRVAATKAGHASGTAGSAATAPTARAATALRVSAARKVRPRKPLTVVVRVGATGVTPTGTVTVRDGGRVLRTVRLTGGRAVVKVRLTKTGKHRLVATYAGTAWATPSSSATTVTVRR